MPKVPWADLAGDAGKAHLLIADLEDTFFEGRSANDPFDSHRLREGVNLLSRVCTRLKLAGTYSITTSRAGSGSLVLCAFENEDDRDRVGGLVDVRCTREDRAEWASRRQFSLTASMHKRLISVGGETDNRYAGRRRRDRERSAAEQSLRWGDV